eukprot:gene12721-26796_t
MLLVSRRFQLRNTVSEIFLLRGHRCSMQYKKANFTMAKPKPLQKSISDTKLNVDYFIGSPSSQIKPVLSIISQEISKLIEKDDQAFNTGSFSLFIKNSQYSWKY